MPRKSIAREDVGQYLSEDFKGGLRQVPGEVRRWFTSNFVQRTLAYMMGWKPDGTTGKLQLAADGSLKVSVVVSQLIEDYGSDADILTDDPDDTTILLPNGANRLDIYVRTADAALEFKKVDNTWGDIILVTTGWHSFDFSMLGFRLANWNLGGGSETNTTWYR